MKIPVLTNSKGISVLFLITAMLVMVGIGYVFSYLIPVKQKSVIFPIGSNQAFYIAQSGVEYAIRYSSDRGWRGTTDSGTYDLTHLNDGGVYQRNLGNGRFTLNYNGGTDELTSTGEVTNASEKRVVRISNFTQLLRLIFNPGSAAPCWSNPTQRVQFYITNNRGTDVTLTAFSASWTQTGATRTIYRIFLDGDRKYQGAYSSGSGVANFNWGTASQTITPGSEIEVEIRWSGNITNGANIIITFYTSAAVGYTFNLDPQGDGLPSC